MENLIELLNEYDGTPTEWKQIGDKIYFDGLGGNSELHELIIISKYYGFIGWLVDNDKIKKDLISRVLVHAYVSPETLVSLECEFYDYYESLLMLLAIQDNPLDFLVKILK